MNKWMSEIIVYNRKHIETVYEVIARLRKSIRLSTPYAGVASAGVHYFLEAYNAVSKGYSDLELPLFIDCGSYPGYVMAALRGGAKNLYVDLENQQTLNALKSIAIKSQALLLTPQDRPENQLDLLLPSKNDKRMIEDWLVKL